MSVSTLDIVVPDSVAAEVQRKLAESEFQAFRETIVDHFSDAGPIEVRLLEDPDEEDRSWVVFEVTFPADTEIDEVLEK